MSVLVWCDGLDAGWNGNLYRLLCDCGVAVCDTGLDSDHFGGGKVVNVFPRRGADGRQISRFLRKLERPEGCGYCRSWNGYRVRKGNGQAYPVDTE